MIAHLKHHPVMKLSGVLLQLHQPLPMANGWVLQMVPKMVDDPLFRPLTIKNGTINGRHHFMLPFFAL
jgi:hypothetical protein